MSDVELEDMSATTGRQPRPGQSTIAQPSADSETVLYWTWTAASILLVAAIPLILFPRFFLFLAEGNGVERRSALTSLESFLTLQVGVLLVALALALITNVPSAPILAQNLRQGSPGHPLLAPLTGACGIIAIISYNTRSIGSLSLLVCLGSAVISLHGLWVLLFEGSSTTSKKTGADKHTSRFLFGNKSAASVQKKQWKTRQARET